MTQWQANRIIELLEEILGRLPEPPESKPTDE